MATSIATKTRKKNLTCPGGRRSLGRRPRINAIEMGRTGTLGRRNETKRTKKRKPAAPSSWKGQALRGLQLAAIALSLVTLLHFNLLSYFPSSEPEGSNLYLDVVHQGFALGLAPLWKMYSPPPAYAHHYDWMESVGEEWKPIVPHPPDLTPDHRRKRSWADALLFDSKRARLLDNSFHYFQYYDRRLPTLYLRYWKKRIEEERGAPMTLRFVVRRAPILPDGKLGEWETFHEEIVR